MDKRGQLAGLDGMVGSLISIAILLGLGVYALITFSTSLNNENATSIINSIITTLSSVPTWLGLVVIGVFVGIVMYLFKRNK